MNEQMKLNEKMKLIVESTKANQVAISTERSVGDDTELRCYTLDPVRAVDVANAILHAAEACGVTVQVQSAPTVTDMQRMALINRAGLIMNSMKGHKPQKIALHIVDSILAEIL